jgi:hypothetical protein
MSKETSFLAGIQYEEILRVVRHGMREHRSLLDMYVTILSMYTKANLYAMREAEKLSSDLRYWKSLARRGRWYRSYAKLFHKGPILFYNHMLDCWNKKELDFPCIEEEDIDAQIAIIERMVFKAEMFIGSLHEGVSYLKRIYLSCMALDRASSVRSTADSSSSLALQSPILGSDVVTIWLSIRKDILRSVWSLAVSGQRLKNGKIEALSEETRSCLASLSTSLLDENRLNIAYHEAQT